jgi:hypothetical protein
VSPAYATLRIGACATVGLACLALTPGPGVAQQACALLTASDVATMLGPDATKKELPGGVMCNWTAADGGRKMQVVVSPLNDETRGHFDEMYGSPGKDAMGEVRRELDLGDRAVSITLRFGVNFEVLKGDHILLIEYASPHLAPTQKDYDALRSLTLKALSKL